MAVGKSNIKILKRLYEGKDETNIHMRDLESVDYQLIRKTTGKELVKTHTDNEHFRDIVTLKFGTRGDKS